MRLTAFRFDSGTPGKKGQRSNSRSATSTHVRLQLLSCGFALSVACVSGARNPPLCVAGAERCTPSSSLTPALPTGKLKNTTAVCQLYNQLLTTRY